MLNKAMRFILRRHADTANAGVYAVRQHEIDDAELATKGNSGLGPPIGQLIQTATSPSGQHHRISVFGDAADKLRGYFSSSQMIFFLQVTLFSFHFASLFNLPCCNAAIIVYNRPT